LRDLGDGLHPFSGDLRKKRGLARQAFTDVGVFGNGHEISLSDKRFTSQRLALC